MFPTKIVHASKSTKDLLDNSDLDVIQWPPNSPVLITIENVWWDLKSGIRSASRNEAGTQKLYNGHMEEVQSDTYQKLINSILERCKNVLQIKGYSTKY